MPATLQFLVDESTGIAVIRYLRGFGYDVLAVAEAMPKADDLDILARAVSERRILVTNDKDFGELVYRSGQAHHGVLLLRLHDKSSAKCVRVVKAILEQYEDQLTSHFIVATESTVRIRPSQRLP